jgi:hypothetical protein
MKIGVPKPSGPYLAVVRHAACDILLTIFNEKAVLLALRNEWRTSIVTSEAQA